jgi:hypothetical protein
MLAPILIEMSGGIMANSTIRKEQSDEEKMVLNMIHSLKYLESLKLVPYPIPQFYLRFFSKYLLSSKDQR